MCQQQLIPGLPDDLARECLIRLPFRAFTAAQSVCHLWRRELDSPYFHRRRRADALTRPLLAFSQAESDPGSSSTATKTDGASVPCYFVSLFDTATGKWVEEGMCPRTCVGGGDGRVYMYEFQQVPFLEAMCWRTVADVPADARVGTKLVAWVGGLMVMGAESYGVAEVGYVLEAGATAWRKVAVSKEYSGYIRGACCLDIGNYEASPGTSGSPNHVATMPRRIETRLEVKRAGSHGRTTSNPDVDAARNAGPRRSKRAQRPPTRLDL